MGMDELLRAAFGSARDLGGSNGRRGSDSGPPGRAVHADWGEGAESIGERSNVFEGLPYALYLPAGSRVRLQAQTVCEVVDSRVPSRAKLKPRLIRPRDVGVSLGGRELLAPDGEPHGPAVRGG